MQISASFDCFTQRNLFQNGTNDMSEMVNVLNDFLSKSSKFKCSSAHPIFVRISPAYGKNIY